MLLTLGIVGAGIYLAYLSYYLRGKVPERLSSWAGGGLYRLLLDKYCIDEFYELVVVRPFTWSSSWLASVFDVRLIDGIINGTADIVKGMSLSWRRVQTGNVQHYLAFFLAGTLLILAYLYR